MQRGHCWFTISYSAYLADLYRFWLPILRLNYLYFRLGIESNMIGAKKLVKKLFTGNYSLKVGPWDHETVLTYLSLPLHFGYVSSAWSDICNFESYISRGVDVLKAEKVSTCRTHAIIRMLRRFGTRELIRTNISSSLNWKDPNVAPTPTTPGCPS